MTSRFGLVAMTGTLVAASSDFLAVPTPLGSLAPSLADHATSDLLEAPTPLGSPAPTPAAYLEASIKLWGDSGDSHSDYCNFEGDALVKSVIYNKEVKDDNGVWVKDEGYNWCWERAHDIFGFPGYYHNLDTPDIRYRMVAGLTSSQSCRDRSSFTHESISSWMRSDRQSCGHGGGWTMWQSLGLAICNAAESDSTMSMLYHLEEVALATGQFYEMPGIGYYCVDVVEGIQAHEYNFDLRTGHISNGPRFDDNKNWVNQFSRLVRPYNASALTCCERKSVDSDASSCPYESSNLNRNWYVPVPGECSDTLSARVIKNPEATGGFLS